MRFSIVFAAAILATTSTASANGQSIVNKTIDAGQHLWISYTVKEGDRVTIAVAPAGSNRSISCKIVNRDDDVRDSSTGWAGQCFMYFASEYDGDYRLRVLNGSDNLPLTVRITTTVVHVNKH